MAAKVFISYRRDDSRYQARMIYEAFSHAMSPEEVFMDIDSIPPGANFRKILRRWVDECDVLLALIGPGWIDARDPKTGQRRLDNSSDFVRIEIGEALARDISVVPVLLDGTSMPDVGLLPEELKQLVDRHAELVEYRTFYADAERLLKKLRLNEDRQDDRDRREGREYLDTAIRDSSSNEIRKGKVPRFQDDVYEDPADLSLEKKAFQPFPVKEEERRPREAEGKRQAEERRRHEAKATQRAEEEARRKQDAADYRGTDYDFISPFVLKTEDDNYEIGYTINSKGRRHEVRPQPVQVRLISNLVRTASNKINDPQIGRTLFDLLVPTDLEPFLRGSTETVLELDESTAAIPWEALEPSTSSDRQKPWSIRTKLLRKLRALPPTIAVTGASADDSILVIGDPACDRSIYPRLMGARQEATKVAECLADLIDGRRVFPVISGSNAGDEEPDAVDVIDALMRRPWRIVHIAGHGEPPVTTGNRTGLRGVVLSDGSFLGTQEINALRVIPELVFVNCCHLATDNPNNLLQLVYYNRAQFASDVAYALIKGGVRCVIAAGWAVDDEAASVFAASFYQALLGGKRFIDAVAAAREKAYACGGNTWAAYQCYGDPDWQF
jgi:CHAT domain/TIR domain